MLNNKFVTTWGVEVTSLYFKEDLDMLDRFQVKRDCYTVLETGEKISLDLFYLNKSSELEWKPVVAIVNGVFQQKSFIIQSKDDLNLARIEWNSRIEYLIEEVWQNCLE